MTKIDGLEIVMTKHIKAQHIEEFAAAFAKRTGLDPTKIKMVSSIRGYRHEVWFEPFPSITEIEQYRKRAELAEAELASRDEIIARLKEDADGDTREKQPAQTVTRAQITEAIKAEQREGV